MTEGAENEGKSKEKEKEKVSKEDLDKLLSFFKMGLRGKKLDAVAKEPVTRMELQTQLSVMSAIIAELYLAVVAQGKDVRKRVTYRIRLGGEIDLFVTCDEKKAKEFMRELRKETTKLLRDLEPFNAMLGTVDTDGDEDAPVPHPHAEDRGYA